MHLVHGVLGRKSMYETFLVPPPIKFENTVYESKLKRIE